MTLIEVSQIILYLSASVLCVFLIFYVGRLVKIVDGIREQIHDLAESLKPSIESLQSLSKNVDSLTNDIKCQLDKISSVIDKSKDKVDTLLNFGQKVKETIDDPISSLVKNLNAIKSGISTFFDRIKT